MQIITDIEQYPLNKQGLVTALGTFDGVHLGHKALLHKASQIAKQHSYASAAITFNTHPRIVLQQQNNIIALNTIDEKIELIKKQGIDYLIVLDFNKKLSSLSSEQFMSEVLIGKLNARHLVLGYNQMFGNDRPKVFEDYSNIAKKLNIGITQVPCIKYELNPVSSSLIRSTICEDGNIELANKLLGHKYFIIGKVIEGNKLGRKLGFPTANIEITDNSKAVPRTGVYACEIIIDNSLYKAMVNVGQRPTVKENFKKTHIEAHVFDYNGDIYGNKVCLSFIKRIRDEIKFNNLEELTAQLILDEKNVRSFFEE